VSATATLPDTVAPSQTQAGPRRRRSRRWLRAVIPFAVLVIVWLGIGIVHAIEEPNLSDPGTLSPTGTGEHGSSQLADLLRSRGISVERVTSSAAALRVAGGSPSTVFVPTPDYLTPSFFARIAQVPSVRKIVVVQPGPRTVILGGLPVFPSVGRWVTRTVAPGCTALASVGAAAVLDTVYQFDPQVQTMNCYRGSVVGVEVDGTESVYVGANDPFRNNRINEAHNADLVTTLLGEYNRVVWLDVHAAEPSPAVAPDIQLPQYRRDDQNRTNTGNSTIDAFPSWLWAGLSLAMVTAVLLAVARARRLGPPVAEPLPVIVPASEAVTGRGRLYERIAAREATLDAIRGAAITRMTHVLNPFGGKPAGAHELVRQIAQRTATPEPAVHAILYGPAPADDAALAEAVGRLDTLTAAVLGHQRPNNQAQSQIPFRGGHP